MSNTSRCALVTGASSGIGRSTAVALAEAGYAVAVAARRREPLDELVAEIESSAGKAVAITADLTKPDDIRRVWTDATEKLGGPIDCLIANAGRGLQGGVTTSDDTQWRQMVELNLTGTMDLMRLAAESMRTGTGVRDIVVIGSVVGVNVSPFSAVYGATKFAIGAAAESLRRDIGKEGIRVTVIKPGIVTTEFQEVAGYDAETFGTAVAKFGRPLSADDVARSIRFVVEQPEGVHINDLMIRPTGQDYP